MKIIIDGYNFIRQTDLRRFENVSLENGRKELIRRLAIYKRAKAHKITVVFDGVMGGSFSEERDRSAGIGIVYSRTGQTADDVIKRMARDSSEKITVVTSDRDIADAAVRSGCNAISSLAFAQKLAEAQMWGAFPEVGVKDEGYSAPKEKKGPSRRVTRRKREEVKNLRKL